MKVVLPTIFNQLEEKNKHILLGLNTDYKYNLYNYGCMFFDLLAAVRYYGKDETVDTFMQKLIANNGFVSGGLYVHGTISKIYPEIKERWVQTPLTLTDSQVADIKSALDSGYPVMVKVDYNPSTLPIEEHYLNVVDYNQADENDMTGADPLGGKLIPMKAYFSWVKFGIRKIIEAYCVISGPVPANMQNSPVIPTPEAPKPIVEPVPSTPPVAVSDVIINTPEPITPIVPIPMETTSTVETMPEVIASDPNTQMRDVLASLIEYLEMDKKPEDTNFENFRRRIAGIKSIATDYWNKKEAAEKELVVTRPVIQSLEDTVSNLQSELLRQQKAHKVEIEAIEATVQNPRNLKRHFDSIYSELKGKHDEYFAELVKLRSENMLMRRELKEYQEAEESGVEEPVKKEEPKPVSDTIFRTKSEYTPNIIVSIIKSFKSFFRSDDL